MPLPMLEDKVPNGGRTIQICTLTLDEGRRIDRSPAAAVKMCMAAASKEHGYIYIHILYMYIC